MTLPADVMDEKRPLIPQTAITITPPAKLITLSATAAAQNKGARLCAPRITIF